MSDIWDPTSSVQDAFVRFYGESSRWVHPRSIETIRKMLFALYSWRREKEKAIKEVEENPEKFGEYADAFYVERQEEAAVADAAYSQAAVGAIAPVLETVLIRSAQVFRKVWETTCRPSMKHHRWKHNHDKDEFWCPYNLFCKKGGKRKRNLLGGAAQLLKALGYKNKFHPALAALMEYRNAVLHHGYDWPEERLRKFDERINAEGWKQYFDVGRAYVGDDRHGEPWSIVLKDDFVKEVLKAVEHLSKELADFAGELAKPELKT